jgi:two-component system phosphate regulon sensor histidine kinase PhoR
VTLIRADGRLLGDSELGAAELAAAANHGDRPEVREALARGHGGATRYSSTLRERMMYVAAAFLRGDRVAGVARVALPLTQVDETVGRLRWLVFVAGALALLAAIVLSSVAAGWTARGVRFVTETARRMAGGNLGLRTRASGTDEIGELGRALDGLAESLSRSLDELRDERDLLGGILQGMREGVLLLDPDGRILVVNAALREMLLLDADVVRRPLLEAVRHAGLRDAIERARRADEPTAGEIETTGLKPRRLLVRAARLGDRQRGLLVVFVDVTDLRRLETIRKDFVANVSHELRTPVASIRSAAETLRDGAAADPQAAARFHEIIERNAERLHRLIDDLLDLSRIESREFRLSLEALDVPEVARHVLSLFRERAEGRRIRLESDFPAGLPPARADRRALEQVLANLIDNAIKYCPEGAAVAVRGETESGQVRLLVVDDGPGIEPQHLPRLFERFYRVDTGRSRELGGTGLGLSIVKHLVEAMHGAVSVESTPGKGSTFTFTLPAA